LADPSHPSRKVGVGMQIKLARPASGLYERISPDSHGCAPQMGIRKAEAIIGNGHGENAP